MQNSIDRQRLLSQFGQEPVHPAAVVAKCAAGIAILIGIALIGITVPADDPVPLAASSQQRDADTQSSVPPRADMAATLSTHNP